MSKQQTETVDPIEAQQQAIEKAEARRAGATVALQKAREVLAAAEAEHQEAVAEHERLAARRPTELEQRLAMEKSWQDTKAGLDPVTRVVGVAPRVR